MLPYQKTFIELALKAEVLKFGEFTLKSGRTSPYFFNAGLFYTGSNLSALGRCYAEAIVQNKMQFDILFGPAYKGIPLVAATSVSLYEHFDTETAWAFNRKEAKSHGEGGTLVGAPMEGDTLIVDDVITAGTAIREVMEMIENCPNARPSGVLVALDRQERGQGSLSAIQEIEKAFSIPVCSIITMSDLMDFIKDHEQLSQFLPSMQAYRDQYGI